MSSRVSERLLALAGINARFITLNADANDLPITTVEAGVWDRAGTTTMRHRDRTVNTLATVDEIEAKGKLHSREVATRTLDDILDGVGVDRVDFLNIQVNGAELQALAGIDLSRVRAVRVTAPYSTEGAPTKPRVVELLSAHGFELGDMGESQHVVASRPGAA